VKLRRTKQEGSAATTAGPSGPSGSADETLVPSLNVGISAEELALVEEMEREVAALQAQPSRKLERGIAITLVVLSVIGILGSRAMEVRTETGGVDPRWWPTVMCGVSLALSLLLTLVSFTKPPFDREDLEVTNRGGWIRLMWTVILSALYIVVWTLTENFVIPSVVLLVALMWIYDGRGWKALVIYPVATVAFIYLLFHTLLKVPL
jgi:hypothetical protein